MNVRQLGILGLSFAVTVPLGAISITEAAEGGSGFYMLGSKGPAAAILPPLPGLYLQNDLYIYSGGMGGSRGIPLGGRIVADIDATAVINVPTAIWVTPTDIAGGSLAFSLSLPFGQKDMEAGLDVVNPVTGTAISRSRQEDRFSFGDPVISGMIGWNSGNWYWQTGIMVNVPIGDYKDGSLSNISFNRWATDLNAAVTWLDPTTGLDVSVASGFTFNGENPATDYKTGTEFHVEWAVSQNFSKQFSAGVIGYYYDQITGDSGAGARLGEYKGRVAAVGATVGYNFELGPMPVSTRLKYFHEFAAENRAEGNSVFLTVAIPLAVSQH
ncbi:SphA family protein [Brucella thiophenivorans]|uniref:MetA-pathway of phenol degradation family protein n=1 Tax=Brucella thiophenivorans TaxID=571255 RepID=A0A256FJS3_9HYPH|nr:transporter [Brucella thiophenivorans]OYR15020.1 metA-pathway of phenol degradation family protein [Brucella thiophenivorans]